METDRIRRYEQAAELLPPRLRRLALELPDVQKERVEEFRLRVRAPLTVSTAEGEQSVCPEGRDILVTREDLEQMVSGVTEFSRYASVETLRQGYLSVRGGFRIGVCGTAVLRDGAVCNVKDFSSLAVRIVREQIGIGERFVPNMFDDAGRFRSTLILSAPGGGKTTLLRDLVRCLSLGMGGYRSLRVAVVDERSEVAMCFHGQPQMELGAKTDVLDGCPKALGIPMLLRAMTPQVIAVDELSSRADVEAVCRAANCGVGLLATAHAESVEELRRKEIWKELFGAEVFKTVICINCSGGERNYQTEELT